MKMYYRGTLANLDLILQNLNIRRILRNLCKNILGFMKQRMKPVTLYGLKMKISLMNIENLLTIMTLIINNQEQL